MKKLFTILLSFVAILGTLLLSNCKKKEIDAEKVAVTLNECETCLKENDKIGAGGVYTINVSAYKADDNDYLTSLEVFIGDVSVYQKEIKSINEVQGFDSLDIEFEVGDGVIASDNSTLRVVVTDQINNEGSASLPIMVKDVTTLNNIQLSFDLNSPGLKAGFLSLPDGTTYNAVDVVPNVANIYLASFYSQSGVYLAAPSSIEADIAYEGAISSWSVRNDLKMEFIEDENLTFAIVRYGDLQQNLFVSKAATTKVYDLQNVAPGTLILFDGDGSKGIVKVNSGSIGVNTSTLNFDILFYQK